MNRIIFNKISFLSIVDKTGFSYNFSPKENFICGENDTGKSSLIKSLYLTLGADVKLDNKWKASKIISKLDIEYNSDKYQFFHYLGNHFILNKEELIFNSNNKKELSEFFKKLFNFNLSLVLTANKEVSLAYPSALYLPFYIDQDSSWSAPLKTFPQIGGMYVHGVTEIIEYHTGIKSAAYYSVISKMEKLKIEKKNKEIILKVTEDSKNSILLNLKSRLFDVDVYSYKEKISSYLDKCRELDEKEINYRNELLELTLRKNEISRNIIEIKNRFKKEVLSNDEILINYQAFENRESLLTINSELLKEKKKIEIEIECKNKEYLTLNSLTKDIKSIILIDEPELSLHDVIKSEASKTIEYVIDSQLKRESDELFVINSELTKLDESKKKLCSSKNRILINNIFQKHLKKAQNDLGLADKKGTISSYAKITSGQTGSRLPRSIFALQYSLLMTISEKSSLPMFPIVMDSPNQQDLDKENLDAIYKLCMDDLSNASQLIIGSVRRDEIMGDNVLLLKNNEQLLTVDGYDDAYDEIFDYLSMVEMEI